MSFFKEERLILCVLISLFLRPEYLFESVFRLVVLCDNGEQGSQEKGRRQQKDIIDRRSGVTFFVNKKKEEC